MALTFQWPNFYHPDKIRLLEHGVERIGRTDEEKHVFRGLAWSIREQALELEMLYRDLPGVLAGDHTAAESFRAILEGAARRGAPPRMNRNEALGLTKASKANLGRGPCNPDFLISPAVIYMLRAGIERIAEGNEVAYEAYLGSLANLWNQARPLDALYRRAKRGVEQDGRDRLREDFELIARDARWGAGRTQRPGIGPGGTREPFPGFDGPAPGPDHPPGQEPPGPLPPDPFPPDPCEQLEQACHDLALDGLGNIQPLPRSASSDRITGIEPGSGCPGTIITIQGSGFGPNQPSNIDVMVGGAIAQVVSWSDTSIEVRVPETAGSGCVGFVDRNMEAVRRSIHRANERAVRKLNTGLRCLTGKEEFPNLPYLGDSPSCTGLNYFEVQRARIRFFRINGQGAITVEPGTEIVLSWEVANASAIEIEIQVQGMPDRTVDVSGQPTGALSLGVFYPEGPQNGRCELIATGACGEARTVVQFFIRTAPALQILGVELIQVIQRFSLTDPAQNNNVPLTARKHTIARVYVESGIRNGFNYGDGPNLLPGITGQIIIWPAQARRGFDAGPPLNGGGVMTARPANEINRFDLTHTLNFELPVEGLTGEVQIEVRAEIQNGNQVFRGLGRWSTLDASTRAQFIERRNIRLLPVMVLIGDEDDAASLLPQAPILFALFQAFNFSGARALFPVAADGFALHLTSGLPAIIGDYDLSHRGEWEDLLDDLESIADDIDEPGLIVAGAVLDDPASNLGGIADAGPPPRMAALIPQPIFFVHELIHTFGLDHSPCGLGDDEEPDPRLQETRTEDLGMDVGDRELILPGTKDLMCGHIVRGDFAWPSISTYEALFNLLA